MFQSSEILGTFLDVWFEKMDNVVQPERKELSALALAGLMNSNAKSHTFKQFINGHKGHLYRFHCKKYFTLDMIF